MLGLAGWPYLGQSKLPSYALSDATAAKLMFCFAMGVWTPPCLNLGNAGLLNRAPRHLPLTVGKRWRCSRAMEGLGGWLAAKWRGAQRASSRIRESTRDRLGRDGQARASRGRGGALCGCLGVVG